MELRPRRRNTPHMLKLIRPLSLPSTYTLVPLRVLTGTGFLLHGLAKLNRGPAKFGALLQYTGVPFPLHTAWAVTLLEIFGGLALIVGAFVTIVSIPLIISMLVAMLSLQIHYGFSAVNTIGLTPSGPVFGPPGYEVNLLYIAGLLALALSPPTAFSIDNLVSRTAHRTVAATISG
jgi:putative oxidoreductase